MPAQPNNRLNPTGRPKGVGNKTTQDVKEAFTLLLQNNIPNLQDWIEQVAERSPERALNILINLAPYVIPRLAQQHISVETQREEIDYSKLTDEQLREILKKSE